MFCQQYAFVVISLMIVWLGYKSFPKFGLKYKIKTFVASMIIFNIMAFILKVLTTN